jgi:hypothetical protein
VAGGESKFNIPTHKVHGAIADVIQGELLPKYLNVLMLDQAQDGKGSQMAGAFSDKFVKDMRQEIDTHVMPILYGDNN